ncbi:phosphoglycerate mutase-like protein [Athelia psychrophila]|uniref:Phosphoglycerate mutase-like protein n=1 Tax=Athelia psychrophila TaxID=1759441 RepID=A0A166ST55_9AGAM|nr:phosphoglycerate mutase-like protein [Fibularhizoctonia sp. CBS 109695]
MSLGYQAVPSFFSQDDPFAQPTVIGALPPRFGLLDDSPDRWSTFKQKISQLNANANDGAVYKVFYLGRHGQGFHNVAEARYGTKLWNEYWAALNGDGELVWGPDPLLTDVGEEQAKEAHAAWAAEIPSGALLPEKLYTSPMTRAMHTNDITFEGLYAGSRPTVTIVENCREHYGKHTCDKRQTRTRIHADFPQLIFEEGFAEEDELWTPVRETEAHIDERARKVLDRVFDQDPETFISITAHGGIVNGILRVIGRNDYALPTGGVLPVVIKAIPVT